MKSFRLQFSFLLFSIVLFANCKTKLDLGEESTLPVISTLFNNRMLLLLKGTYATDNPLDWSELNNGTGDLYIDTQGEGLDPTMTLTNLPKAGNLPIFLDIGEVRISSKYLKGLNELTQIRDTVDSNKFWDYIAPNRQVFCTVTYSFDNNTCTESNGVLKAYDFFNGIGAQFPSNDPSSETRSWEEALAAGQPWLGREYYYAGIYFRSLVTGYALDAGIPVRGRFDNRPIVNGLNIVPRNNYVAGTSTAEKSSIVPKLFPALFTQLPTQSVQSDMRIRDGFDPYILEVRINLKENLMLHSYTSSRSTTVTYAGVSDIFFDHKGEGDAGGNLLTRARVIYPEVASSLTISGGGNSLLHYYGIFRFQETEFINVLPLAATPAKQSAKIKYLNPGTYKVVCLGDLSKRDGYPDTVVRETAFTIPDYPFRQTYNVDLACP
ncbi:hypothetical protein EHQ92_06230 [Leptospira biflexa]|jgi:hypothetical protein|uniref:Lipoprotein n=1 Tax=Leptospira biflexa serovar Patoc (strain Patoc 1 / ATCC 23582 / Paris) TaxID=456481 RepID=B0SJC2_LEPBP|nr:hypothetical protein [Leptospira biflexa]ABZ93066.1 Hypothetical lipoprotein [Leptospira biflexa serovar Patoc strain 'Patoc 1 (Ames)']ABZ96685.1 Conserved hypothetical protein [Leptospira biflexa serovar Patoc strain 'Patoc 1 (Paris)']TGM37972.1 hypothetical protein EHQ80_10415 [Leptospira biflexa]TGM41303.1 hypothetical protein EHQ89_04980 [Leptospira biflexa]TGM47506.1 hypothetical protein EHQ92_06230 [Leptospira biflexa]